MRSERVFRKFRSGFLGKCSPVHFFWGSFDLAVTRFSGRPAPAHPGATGLPDPDAALLDFQSTYEAAADLARWDRAALERAPRP